MRCLIISDKKWCLTNWYVRYLKVAWSEKREINERSSSSSSILVTSFFAFVHRCFSLLVLRKRFEFWDLATCHRFELHYCNSLITSPHRTALSSLPQRMHYFFRGFHYYLSFYFLFFFLNSALAKIYICLILLSVLGNQSTMNRI